MPNPRSILSGLAKAIEPAQETKAVGNAAIEEALRMLDQKRLGVWDGKEPYDIWKARREAEMGVKKADGGAINLDNIVLAALRKSAGMANGGRTRAGTKAQPFPWEEALEAQLGRTKKRLKGLATDPVQEGVNIVRQYLHDPTASPEENERKLDELAMGFVGSTTGKVGNVKVKSTVKDPERMAFPGIYQRPDVIAAEAASRVAEESPNLQKVFGVTREDLFQMGKGRQGNLPGNLPGAAAKPKGSAAAARVMGSKNVQRIIDTMAEAEKHPRLVQGMDPWYVMDPVYQRMEQLLGRDKAIEEYRKLNTLMGMASPGSEVLTEIPRGTAAYYLQKQGRFPEFMEYAGKPAGARGTGFPADILNVPGHAYHKTAQALPMQQFLESGEMQMSSPKVPMYIEASGVPQTGFQTRTPVGDAHWSRAVGLADTRGAATRKGQPIVPGASVTNPEMSLLGPWWREEVAAPMGLESVPAQARAWGTFSGQTGVTTPIGAPKIELLADKIVETAHRLGVSINKARDLVLMGETYAGKKNGGLAMATGGQAFPLQEEFQAEVERRAARPRTRAGVPVEDTNVLGGALQGLGETLLGAGRGAFATTLGSPADILNLLNVKQFGTPDIPYGSEFFKEILPLAPTTQTGQTAQQLGEFLPIDVRKPAEAVAAGAKKLAPTAKELLETGLEKAVAPTRMYAVPPGEVKPGKVKAPANDLGFYNPAEKAALNLQRKKGTGDAFLADLKKQPGVNDERLTELGLDQFKGRPNVTREEIIAATEERRIPLQESVKRERDEVAIDELEREHDEILEAMNEARASGNRHTLAQLDAQLQDNLINQDALKMVDEARFGPSSHPDYVMPGGTDYREIRVNIPEKKAALPSMEGFTVETIRENKLTGQRDILIKNQKGNVVSNRYGFRGNDEQALLDEAKSRARDEGRENNFYHQNHHGNEPNVLFHLRVANHADAEGKKGLLIDELQSDWHQQGSKKGYGPKYEDRYRAYYDTPTGQVDIGFGKTPEEVERMVKVSGWEGMPVEIKTEKTKAKIGQGVPEAPFKDNWYQLGLKRAIKEAADTGMDRVYLTTGKRQIDRYENALRANVDAIEYEPYKGDNGELLFEISGVKNGQEVINKEGLTYKELEELVGKDMASKMKSNAGESLADERPMRPHWMRLSGDNLSIGGEGMKQWYDKTYKNYLEKYAKQHGSKLGETRLPAAAVTRDQLSTSDIENLMGNPEFKKILDEEFVKFSNSPRVTGKIEPQGEGQFKVVWSDGTFSGGYNAEGARERLALGRNKEPGEKAVWNAALKRFGGEKVYYIDITDAMRESAKKGQSYKDGGAVSDGAVNLDNILLNALSRKMADGGAAYNTSPDMSDGGQMLQGDAF